jgi:hypothetical protein
VGTFTTGLTIQGSGTAGNVITILFESGAKFSKPYLDTYGAIVSYNKSYITIDGNNTGVIENTDNGTALNNHLDSYAMLLEGGTAVEIKNLTIRNLYVRTPNTNDGASGNTTGIRANSVVNLRIHDNVITHAKYGILAQAENRTTDSLSIYRNDVSLSSTALAVCASSTGFSYTNVDIYSNNFHNGYTWWSTDELFHNDGIHVFMLKSTAYIGPLKIYNNKIYGDWGRRITGLIFTEGTVADLRIYNNLLTITGTANPGQNLPAEALMDLGTSYVNASALIYGNTASGIGSAVGGACAF